MFLTCSSWVRSVDLGTATVLLDLRSGHVETLLAGAHEAWQALARTGDVESLSATSGDRALAVRLLEELRAESVLVATTTATPWTVPMTAASVASWGTNEVVAATVPRGRTPAAGTALAGAVLIGVLLAKNLGRRSCSFSRIVALLTASTRWPRRYATAVEVERALHCVRNVAAVLPCRVACLEETAAATLVLAVTGRRVGWYHGVAADPIRLHAWMTLESRPVAEPASTDRYTPLLKI